MSTVNSKCCNSVSGCLVDGVVTAAPDVPPRNPTMSRLNGRLAAPGVQMGGDQGNQDFEPSCLVRTPSGNVYIPTGTLSKYFFLILNIYFISFNTINEIVKIKSEFRNFQNDI